MHTIVARASATALIAVGIAIHAPNFTSNAMAQDAPAICRVNSGTNGGKNYAVFKCFDPKRPTVVVLSKTIWENLNPKAYRQLLKMGNKNRKCTISRTGFKCEG